jgi:DNA-binding transcriptional LysR family regulator
LRIASIPSLSLELLPDTIRRFRARDPDYSFSLSSLNTEEILSRLDERFGSFHVGITLGPVFESHVTSEEIGEAEVLAVFPSGWDLPESAEISIADIEDRPFIAGFDGTALTLSCTDLFREAGVSPQVVARSHSYHLAGRLVEQGVGYALLDAITIRALLHDRDSGQFTVRRLVGRPQLPITVILPGRRTTHRAVRPFIDSLEEAFTALSSTVEARLP